MNPSTHKSYAGIGARITPGNILDDDTALGACSSYAKLLAVGGFILRSGGANGADYAFETGCDSEDGNKEIFIPWEGFNGSKSLLFNIPDKAFEIAKDVYGINRWGNCKDSVKKLMARTIMQITGADLVDPCEFVICWTPDGCTTKEARTPKTGGTGQAIAYADTLKIPIYNLANQLSKHFLLDFLAR